MPFRKSKEPSALDKEISRLTSDLENEGAMTDDYDRIADQLVKLTELRDKTESSKQRVSPDTLAVIGGNTVIALIVVTAEKHTLVSKYLTNVLTKLK
jgi:hypothetical protein